MSDIHKDLAELADAGSTMSRLLSRPLVPANIKSAASEMLDHANANLASQFHKRLKNAIAGFDAQLDDQHEVGVRLVNFGQTVTFHLQGMGYFNPSLIVFKGTTTTGEPVELIQHVSQISVLLMKLPRLEPEKPKERGWFHPLKVEGEGA